MPVTEANAQTLSGQWGFPVPAQPGFTAPESIDAAHRGALDVLMSVGGNFLEVLPDPDYVESGLRRIPLRVHMDLVLSPQMLLEPADTVLLLPAATRYETPGGVTQTTTERRVVFSPEIPGRRIAEARPEWQVFTDLARRARSEHASAFQFGGTQEVRSEIATLIPAYDGIQGLRARGDQFQYGGEHLCAGWAFPTGDGKARFAAVPLPVRPSVRDGTFLVATRRGKQFNSIAWCMSTRTPSPAPAATPC